MYKNIKNLLILLSLIMLTACSNDYPTTIHFNGAQYDHYQTQESSGGKFNIHEYRHRGSDRLYLVTPHEQADMDSFANIYTKTFTSQGFRFNNSASRYLGVSDNNVVYLGVSRNLNSLGIYLVEKSEKSPLSISGASTLFSELEGLY